jgi:hypothetical protein
MKVIVNLKHRFVTLSLCNRCSVSGSEPPLISKISKTGKTGVKLFFIKYSLDPYQFPQLT